MGWLLGQFGREHFLQRPVVVPTKDFFPEKYDQSETAARGLFERTCGYMGIDPASIELVFHQPRIGQAWPRASSAKICHGPGCM